MPISLLSTKFFLPAPPAGWVRRARLEGRLNEALLPGKKLLLLSAPPGYGKTTLLGAWFAAGIPARVAWLSLDPADNDPIRFALYLLHALGRACPGLGEHLSYALQSPQPPPLEAVLEALINEIVERDEPLLLALDDFHLIKAQPVQEAARFLLEHLPPKMRLAVLTRTDPPLPLARLRARGQLVELRADDLRFTPTETAEFLNQVMGLGLPAGDVALLESRTEGWIAGLQLAALSLRSRPDAAAFIRAFSGSHVFILDYLTEEVLDRQPPAVRDFLLRTCVLDRLTGALCDCLLGDSCAAPEAGSPTPSQAMLETLARENLFIIPLDADAAGGMGAGWFRYHHLFADLLRAQLQRSAPNLAPELHRRASRWFADHSLTGEAIQHALAAGEVDRAAALAEARGLEMLMQGEIVTLQSWLLALPEKAVHARPRLSVYQAWIALLTGRLDQIEPFLQPAERALNADSPAAPDADFVAGQIAAIRAYSASLFGQAAPAIAYAQEALARLPAGEGQIRSVVFYVLGGAYILSGQPEQAVEALTQAGRVGRASGNLHMAVPATCALAGMQMVMGQLRRAAETLAEALEMTRLPDGSLTPLAARVYSSQADLDYEHNDLPASLRAAEEGTRLARQWGNMEVLSKNYVAQARALLAMERLEECEAALEQAERINSQHMASPGQSNFAAAWRARAWLARPATGLAQAARWLDQRGLSAEGQPNFVDEHEYLAAARVLRALGRLEEAARLAERVAQSAQEGRRAGRSVEALALLGALLAEQGQAGPARDHLLDALRLAAPEGHTRSLIDAGPALQPLLADLRGHPNIPTLRGTIDRLLAAFSPATGVAPATPVEPTPAAPEALVDPLSARELEVLRLVAAGYSNAAIAEKLVIALSTVKRHLNHILDKLQATSRTQAVAHARDLGLL